MAVIQNALVGSNNTYSGGTATAGEFKTTNYDIKKSFLTNLKIRMILEKFCLQKPITQKGTRTIMMPKMVKLPRASKLQEGVTPAARKSQVSHVLATLEQYGDYQNLSDLLVKFGDVVDAEVIGVEQSYQASLTREAAIRDAMIAGTNVVYANGSARTDLLQPITESAIRKIVNFFYKNSVEAPMRMFKGNSNNDTVIVGESFIGYAAPDIIASLEALPKWVPIEKYGSLGGSILPGERGSIAGVRFCMTPLLQPSELSGYADGGATMAGHSVVSTTGTSADVYPTIIMGAEAMGISKANGNAVEIIQKKLGEGDDPLNQRMTMGWKMDMVAKVLDNTQIVRLESTAVLIDATGTLAAS